MAQPDKVPITVRPALDPAGLTGVLLQLPDGWLIVAPEAARQLAATLIDVADETEAIRGGEGQPWTGQGQR